MKIKERYITKTLLSYTSIVLLVWLSIYSFFNFLTELNSVGTNSYTILSAFQYIIFKIPEVVYSQASPIILLGCILGMGHLASTNQLIIFRTSGISIFKISILTLKNALFFIIIIIIFGEFIAPFSSNYAQLLRSDALDISDIKDSQQGFWIRDGNNFINVKNNIDGRFFTDITIIEVNSDKKIERVTSSESGLFDNNSLDLKNSNIFSIETKGAYDFIVLKERNLYNKIVSFDQDLIDSLEKEPEDLTTWTIIKQIQFLSDNKLGSGVFEIELYKRIMKPLNLIGMILLAMLFIFGSTRDVTLGRKIFLGVALGLTFELLTQIGGATALSFNFSPFISTFTPSAIVLIVALTMIVRKSMTQ